MKLLLLFLIIGQTAFGQVHDKGIAPYNIQMNGKDINVTVENIKKLFEESISYISFPRIFWNVCNQDSAYFKKDTLYFYQEMYDSIGLPKPCCAIISWGFYEPNSFCYVEDGECSRNLAVAYPTVKLFTKQSRVYLDVYNREQLMDKFRVERLFSFQETSLPCISKLLILIRQK